jgi:hypothetical protein
MRHRWISLFAAAAALAGTALAVVAVAPPASAAENLVTNPGFETGALSGWSCTGGSVVTSPVHTPAPAR